MASINFRAGILNDEVRKAHGPNYPELLARLFEDDHIDEYSLIPGPNRKGFKPSEASKRLTTILSASRNKPGQHFAGIFTGWSDLGFKADFKDPHPHSRNQCGHFMTAVHLSFAPAILYRASALTHLHDLGSSSANRRAARRLAVGHEFVTDGVFMHPHMAYLKGYWHESTFKRAVSAMHQQRRSSATGWANVAAAKQILKDLPIDEKKAGNSHADMLLTAVGWYFGELIAAGQITQRDAAGAFVRDTLGTSSKRLPPPHEGLG